MGRATWLAALLALGGCQGATPLVFPAPPEVRVPLLPGGTMVRGGHDRTAFLALHRPAAPGHRTVVFFHGNGDQIGGLPVLLDRLSASQLGVYAVEYPGYGLLPGTPSEARLYDSAEAALALLHGPLGVPPAQVVLVGHSIGSGVAVEMARRQHGDRLALLSPFTSLDAVASSLAGGLDVWLGDNHFDNLSRAPLVSCPVLLIHGTRDRFVPGWMSQELERAFPDAALFWAPGAGHGDLFVGKRGEAILNLLHLFAETSLEPVAGRR